MHVSSSLQYTRWECKYHIVFIPKYRRKTLHRAIRLEIGRVFYELADRKGCRIEECHIMKYHVHMLLSVHPKYSVSQVVGYIKGKNTIHIVRTYVGEKEEL